MLYRDKLTYRNKINNCRNPTQEQMDSRGIVKIIQPGSDYGKMGIIIKEFENIPGQKWCIIRVDGEELRLPDNMLDRSDHEFL